MSDRLQFIDDVLAGLSLPHGKIATLGMLGWTAAESGTEPCDGMAGARYNPLNTTEPATGATDFNSVGVKNYPSWTVGVAATIATLRLNYYTDIRHQLATATTTKQIADAIAASPWGTGQAIYGGMQAVEANAVRYSSLPVGQATPTPPPPHLTWRVLKDGHGIYRGTGLTGALAVIAAQAKRHEHERGWAITLNRIEVP